MFVGLSGAMSTVLMVFDYVSAANWELEERTVSNSTEYARVASDMPYVEGSIHYELFHPIEDSEAVQS